MASTISTQTLSPLRQGLNFKIVSQAVYRILAQYHSLPKTQHDLQRRIVYAIARVFNLSAYRFATLKNTVIWRIGESYVTCPYVTNYKLNPDNLAAETANIFLTIKYMDFIYASKISNTLKKQCQYIIDMAYGDDSELIYYGEKENLHLFKTNNDVEYIIENTVLSGGRIHIHRSISYA